MLLFIKHTKLYYLNKTIYLCIESQKYKMLKYIFKTQHVNLNFSKQISFL